jgi:drug/metabolite transporter (DMT)-like permease
MKGRPLNTGEPSIVVLPKITFYRRPASWFYPPVLRAMGYYSKEVLATLILMIVTGAGRTLAVKVYFQLGYDDPFLVAILMLLGHSLAVPIYWLAEWLVPETDLVVDANTAEDGAEMNHSDEADLEMEGKVAAGVSEVPPDRPVNSKLRSLGILVQTDWRHDSTLVASGWEELENVEAPEEESSQTRHAAPTGSACGPVEEDPEGETEEILQRIRRARERASNRGSVHGLNEQSHEAVQWVHKIPDWAKPLMSSYFNLLDVGFRMLAILYLAASVAEMLIGGMELILSIVAARVVRKRDIAKQRWCGAGIMMVGLVLVACSDLVSDNESSESFGLGILFVFMKVIMGVSKDMTQELFMQEGKFSTTLLLGMESVYGVLMAVPLYFILGPFAGYDPVESFRGIGESSLSIGYTMGLILVFLVAGMYSILGTAVTSSMTRNMWKNFRGLVVWTAALIIFYAIGDEDIGEPWMIPGSFMILAGFSVMLGALYVYYCVKM